MKTVLLSVALASSVLLSGCVVSVGGGSDSHYGSDWEDREFNNRKHIANLETGTTYESVLRKMGVADFNELFEKQDGTYRVLYYRTQKNDGRWYHHKRRVYAVGFQKWKLSWLG